MGSLRWRSIYLQWQSSSNWAIGNECSDAMPVSTSDCACDEQDVGNEILPSFTEGVVRGSCSYCCANPTIEEIKRNIRQRNLRAQGHSLSSRSR